MKAFYHNKHFILGEGWENGGVVGFRAWGTTRGLRA